MIFPVNQLTEIHDLQDKANFLHDSKDVNDNETASSSGLSHVPSHLFTVPSPRGILSRDSCFQSDTRNLFGTPRNVFENPFEQDERTSSCSRIVDTRSFGAHMQKNTQFFALPTPRFGREFSTWNPPTRAQGVGSQIVWLSNRDVTERHFDKSPLSQHSCVGKRSSKP